MNRFRAILVMVSLIFSTLMAIHPVSASAAESYDPNKLITISSTVTNVQETHAIPVTHVVKNGDSLSLIAHDYDIAWQSLYCGNKKQIGANPDLIIPGERLIVPGKNVKGSCPIHEDGLKLTSNVIITSRGTPSHNSPVSKLPAIPKSGSSGCYDPSGVLTRSQIAMLWLCAGGPSWAVSSAEAVSYCESGWNTHAYNPSGASGLWQILGQVVGGYVFDAHVNALNAVSKFKASGDTWAQWVCKP